GVRAPRCGHGRGRAAARREVAEAPVGVRAAAGEEPEEVRLARPVRAEHRDAVAEPHLEIERLHEPRQLEMLRDDRTLARAGSAQAQRELLLGRTLLGRPGLLEAPQ